VGALAGFAANSLLTRAAVGPGLIDSVSFSTIRLATGAIALMLLARLRASKPASMGSWRGALALAAYAYAFAFAYERINAGVGALLLFGSVQSTMMTWGVWRGERPGIADVAGLVLALLGLVFLTRPGLAAPDSLGSVLMVAAGVAWGIYSLLGRGGGDALDQTAGNFRLATLVGVGMSLVVLGRTEISGRGIALASASGALASGLGYTLWYTALPYLSAWRAAVLQLSVPVLTALGAVMLLNERLTMRLVAAGAMIASGVLLSTLWSGARRK
jgi:drug/metabolite transporter (DMT)-like permease